MDASTRCMMIQYLYNWLKSIFYWMEREEARAVVHMMMHMGVASDACRSSQASARLLSCLMHVVKMPKKELRPQSSTIYVLSNKFVARGASVCTTHTMTTTIEPEQGRKTVYGQSICSQLHF